MKQWTQDFINIQVFINFDSSKQHNEQLEPTTGIPTRIVNLKPPMAQNLQNSIKWTGIEPPRAHNSSNSTLGQSTTKMDSISTETAQICENWIAYDSITIARTQTQFSPPNCQESHDSLQYPTLICRGVQIRRSCC